MRKNTALNFVGFADISVDDNILYDCGIFCYFAHKKEQQPNIGIMKVFQGHRGLKLPVIFMNNASFPKLYLSLLLGGTGLRKCKLRTDFKGGLLKTVSALEVDRHAR